MPVKHIVLMKFKVDTPADVLQKATSNLLALKGVCFKVARKMLRSASDVVSEPVSLDLTARKRQARSPASWTFRSAPPSRLIAATAILMPWSSTSTTKLPSRSCLIARVDLDIAQGYVPDLWACREADVRPSS